MPDPIYSNVVNLLQLAIMLLIPLEILLAATLRIKADYEMRDTLATMVYAIFDPRLQELTLANAGHLPPVL